MALFLPAQPPPRRGAKRRGVQPARSDLLPPRSHARAAVDGVGGESDGTLIFLDAPYGPMLQGKYLPHPSQLGDMQTTTFFDQMARVVTYWEIGSLVLIMGCLQKEGRFVALPFE